MIKFGRRGALKAAIVMLVGAGAGTLRAGDWTDAAEVRYDDSLCVSYRARWDGPFLVVRATLASGWHTFAMDNRRRAEEKLAGKQSLGIDHPTEIILAGGVEVAGPWYQSPPKDFSKPELRWFSWGFEQQAVFVAKVRRGPAAPARITVRGQACTDTICKNIDVAISLPPGKLKTADRDRSDINLANLVQVR